MIIKLACGCEVNKELHWQNRDKINGLSILSRWMLSAFCHEIKEARDLGTEDSYFEEHLADLPENYYS